MERMRSCLERIADAHERVAIALDRLSDGWANANPDRPVAGRMDRETQREKAVRLLVQMGTDNITAVAKAVGVSRKTLYQWPETRKVMDRLRAIQVWEVRSPRAARPEEL